MGWVGEEVQANALSCFRRGLKGNSTSRARAMLTATSLPPAKFTHSRLAKIHVSIQNKAQRISHPCHPPNVSGSTVAPGMAAPPELCSIRRCASRAQICAGPASRSACPACSPGCLPSELAPACCARCAMACVGHSMRADLRMGCLLLSSKIQSPTKQIRAAAHLQSNLVVAPGRQLPDRMSCL